MTETEVCHCAILTLDCEVGALHDIVNKVVHRSEVALRIGKVCTEIGAVPAICLCLVDEVDIIWSIDRLKKGAVVVAQVLHKCHTLVYLKHNICLALT